MTQNISVTENHKTQLQEEKKRLEEDLETTRYTVCYFFYYKCYVYNHSAVAKMNDFIEFNFSSAHI